MKTPRFLSPSRPAFLALFVTAACSLLLSFSSPAPTRAQDPQDDEVIRVNTDLVILNVTVTGAQGEYAHGLTRQDFQVFEDRREQTISSFSVEETPFAAAILIDTSGSMEGRISLARAAAIRFLDGLRPDDVAAVYRFDSEAERVQDFSSSRDLAPLVYNLGARGMTTLNDAIVQAARDLAERPERRRAILVLSDGADTRSSASADRALNSALAANATIYTVDMSSPESGNQAERQRGIAALRQFASRSGGRFVSSPGGQALREAFVSILEELSNQYTLSYQPTNRARDGRWRAIEVRLARPNLNARTRQGYRAPRS